EVKQRSRFNGRPPVCKTGCRDSNPHSPASYYGGAQRWEWGLGRRKQNGAKTREPMSTQVTKVKNEEAQGGAPSFQMPGPIQRITEYPRRFRQFLHEVRVGRKQGLWPVRDELLAPTTGVMAPLAFFGSYFLSGIAGWG